MANVIDKTDDVVAQAINQFERDNFRDGDLVSHEWLKWALDLPEPQGTAEEARQAQITRMNRTQDFMQRLLESRQIALESVTGQGYRIVPPNEQAGYAAEVASRHIDKGLRKGRNILSNTRVTQLTAEERRRHDDAAAKMDSFRQMVKRERKSLLAPFGR
jgi:hypothetical protein